MTKRIVPQSNVKSSHRMFSVTVLTPNSATVLKVKNSVLIVVIACKCVITHTYKHYDQGVAIFFSDSKVTINVQMC